MGYTGATNLYIPQYDEKKMKKGIFVTLFSLATSCAYSQLYQYTYDAAGNRTVRKYSPNGMSILNDEDENDEEVQLSKMMQKHEVNICTTEEEINIKVSNIDKETQAEVTVYDIRGIQVAQAAIREEETKIDMSGQSTGVYVTKVTVNGESTSWKVAKK